MADGFEFHVDKTSIMLFASALGEENRIYYDEAYAKESGLGGVIAPPTFPIASAHWNPDHALRGVRRIPAPPEVAPPEPVAAPAAADEGAPKGGGGGLLRLLHGEQRFRWHKPMRPGMTLTVGTRFGRRWTKQGRRGGEMQFQESITEYRDADGELVVTATSVAIRTGQVVEG